MVALTSLIKLTNWLKVGLLGHGGLGLTHRFGLNYIFSVLNEFVKVEVMRLVRR